MMKGPQAMPRLSRFVLTKGFAGGWCVLVLFVTVLISGCGDAANTVVEPGAEYQRTPAEEARFQMQEPVGNQSASDR